MLRHTLSALVAVFATLSSAHAQEVTLKLSAFIPAKAATYSEVIKPWVDAINAEGKGIVRIDTFPGGALGGNPGLQPKMVLDGVADIAFVVQAYSPGRFPDDEVMELPDMVKNSTESSLAMYRLYKRNLLRGYDEFYVALLGTTGPYAIHAKKPINTLADIKGLKLRAGGPVASATIRALGAVPVGMPITEVAENVSRGVIDGTAGNWEVMYSFRIIETANHHYMAWMGTVPIALLMNRKVYDGLSAKAKAIIDKNSGEVMSRRYGGSQDRIHVIKDKETRTNPNHTVVDPSDADLAQWKAIMASVISNWVKENPKGQVLYSGLRDELSTIRAGR